MRVDAKQLARAGYTYLGRLYSEMDCQAFIEKCLSDCGLKMNLPGSNAWYRKMDWTGTPEECKKVFGKVPVGAFLFILKQDGKEPEKYKSDGKGNASHIGIYTGQAKGAIHSSASRGCVDESRFAGKSINGGWNCVGLWKMVTYDTDIDMSITNTGGNKNVKTGEKAKVVLVSGESGNTVNLREGPGLDFGRICKVRVDSVVEIIEDRGKWSNISVDGKKGWMLSNHLEYIDEGVLIDEDQGDDTSKIDRALSTIEAAVKTINEQIDVIGSINGRG